MEAYILTGICLATFIITVIVFRFIFEDPEYGMFFGSLAGLLLAIAAGGAYYMHLARCTACI